MTVIAYLNTTYVNPCLYTTSLSWLDLLKVLYLVEWFAAKGSIAHEHACLTRIPIACQHNRHVMLPKQLSKLVPTSHLMSEEEWRGLGVQQSQGWIHYMVHKPGEEHAKK